MAKSISVDTIIERTSGAGVQIQGISGSGTAATGYVGEKLTTTVSSLFSQTTATAGTFYDITGATIALTAGEWEINATFSIGAVTASGGTTMAAVYGNLRNAAGTLLTNQIGMMVGGDAANAYLPRQTSGAVSLHYIANLAAPDTHKLSISWSSFSGSPVVDLRVEAGVAPLRITARRIR